MMLTFAHRLTSKIPTKKVDPYDPTPKPKPCIPVSKTATKSRYLADEYAFIKSVVSAIITGLVANQLGTQMAAVYAMIDLLLGNTTGNPVLAMMFPTKQGEKQLEQFQRYGRHQESFQISYMLYQMLWLPCLFLWSTSDMPIQLLEWCGMDTALADMAQRYLKVAVWNQVLRELLDGFAGIFREEERIVESVVTLVAVFVWSECFEIGLEDVGIIVFVVSMGFFAIEARTALWNGWLKGFLTDLFAPSLYKILTMGFIFMFSFNRQMTLHLAVIALAVAFVSSNSVMYISFGSDWLRITGVSPSSRQTFVEKKKYLHR